MNTRCEANARIGPPTTVQGFPVERIQRAGNRLVDFDHLRCPDLERPGWSRTSSGRIGTAARRPRRRSGPVGATLDGQAGCGRNLGTTMVNGTC